MPAKLVILSDIRLYREGIALNIITRNLPVRVETCANAEEAVQLIADSTEAVILIDTGMAGSLREVCQIRTRAPHARILAIRIPPDSHEEILLAAEAGVSGYLPAEAGVEELMAAVVQVSTGEVPNWAGFVGKPGRRAAPIASMPAPAAAIRALTAREQEVLALLDIGLSNKQIARQLSIRLATVKNHVHSILAKLNVKRRGEAVAASTGKIRVSMRAEASDWGR